MNQNGSVNFSITEEQKMIQQLARDFARNEIAPVAEHYDQAHEYPWPVLKKAQELGLTVMNVPEDYGGLGLSLFEEVLVGEELSWGCSGISTSISINGLALLPILIAGGDEQKKEYFGRSVDGQMSGYCATEPEAGSDLPA
jgi:acyl-CoA dehydrogenase